MGEIYRRLNDPHENSAFLQKTLKTRPSMTFMLEKKRKRKLEDALYGGKTEKDFMANEVKHSLVNLNFT